MYVPSPDAIVFVFTLSPELVGVSATVWPGVHVFCRD